MQCCRDKESYVFFSLQARGRGRRGSLFVSPRGRNLGDPGRSTRPLTRDACAVASPEASTGAVTLDDVVWEKGHAIAKGEKYEVDPTVWTIVDGKLYLNFNRQTRDQWRKDRVANIRKADERWSDMRQ